MRCAAPSCSQRLLFRRRCRVRRWSTASSEGKEACGVGEPSGFAKRKWRKGGGRPPSHSPSAPPAPSPLCSGAASSSPLILRSIDCHAGGEPARVVVEGLPDIPGETMYEKRRYCMENLDHLRRLMLEEPRGYPCQNANWIVEPCSEEASYGYVILEQGKIYPLMSGHNTMCVATALLETGMIPMESETVEFKLEAPGGLVAIRAKCDPSRGTVDEVCIEGYPSFVALEGVPVQVPELGTVDVSIAYGGMWYVIVDAKALPSGPLDLRPENGGTIARLGEMIKIAAREQHPVNHPDLDYPGPDILVFTAEAHGPAEAAGAGAGGRRRDGLGAIRRRNTVVMSNGELVWSKPETWTGMLDRSPCGTGTCAVMAHLYSKGELELNQDFIHESVVDSVFTGRLLREVEVGGFKAVVPEIAGRAWVTAYTELFLDPTDPFPSGYTVGDIWAT